MYAMLILVHYYNSNTTYFSVANKLSSNSMAYVHCSTADFFFTIAKNSALLYTDKDAINCTILNKNATKVTYVVYLEYQF